jgi:hypothetical protein
MSSVCGCVASAADDTRRRARFDCHPDNIHWCSTIHNTKVRTRRELRIHRCTWGGSVVTPWGGSVTLGLQCYTGAPLSTTPRCAKESVSETSSRERRVRRFTPGSVRIWTETRAQRSTPGGRSSTRSCGRGPFSSEQAASYVVESMSMRRGWTRGDVYHVSQAFRPPATDLEECYD